VKLLITGAGGQVGRSLLQARWPRGAEIVGLQRSKLDIASADAIAATIAAIRPTTIINAAAYTAVDKAENDSASAFRVNNDGAARLAEAAHRVGAALIHLSTDYVFDGRSPVPYRESDPTTPINTYGRSKVAGENAVRLHQPQHVILRTAWVYASHGHNFVRTMLRLAAEREEVSVVDDQIGTPTSAANIAAALMVICQRIYDDQQAGHDSAWGTYHFTDAGETTWHGVAAHVFDRLQAQRRRCPRLKAIATADYPSPAKRPSNSRLDCSRIERTFQIERRPWRQSLDSVLEELVSEAMPTPADARESSAS
jgi:dTDP-4-dehydrorhamnose reductase